jgi:hypothetical protein
MLGVRRQDVEGPLHQKTAHLVVHMVDLGALFYPSGAWRSIGAINAEISPKPLPSPKKSVLEMSTLCCGP